VQEIRERFRAVRAARRLRFALLPLVAVSLAGTVAPSASAVVGYELDASTPSRSLGGKIPHGIAVDQASQRIYVAILTTGAISGGPGEVDRFESNLNAAGTFTAGGESFYTGVAVNPVTQGFYATQAKLPASLGGKGTSRMDPFSSSGVLGTPFAVGQTETLPQIATDSSGDVYYPNAATHTVQVFNSAGVLQEEIACGGCTGGAFGKPVSVALDSDANLYVVDLSPDRVVKFAPSGGSYAFASVLQSGRGAAAVAVDPSTDDVLVGDLPGGAGYRIAAYSSAGVQFDEFGNGLFVDPEAQFGALIAAQIAANATTHEVYVGDAGEFHIFDKVTAHPPTATIQPANPAGQLTATLHAQVNTSGHTATECDFEYTDDADFQANGFSNATDLTCPDPPRGTGGKPIDAAISGLSPATTYHYRVTITTYAGTVTSGGEAFTTAPVALAAVTTEQPASIGEEFATLKATANAKGGSVSQCYFEYGTSTSYGTKVTCPTAVKADFTTVMQSRKVLKLTPGTTYHYRLVVVTNAGTANGNDIEFKTAAPPALENEEPPSTSPPPDTTAPAPAPAPSPAPRPLKCKKGFKKKKVRGKLRCVKKKRHAKRRAHRS
jgi:hypothetical protein